MGFQQDGAVKSLWRLEWFLRGYLFHYSAILYVRYGHLSMNLHPGWGWYYDGELCPQWSHVPCQQRFVRGAWSPWSSGFPWANNRFHTSRAAVDRKNIKQTHAKSLMGQCRCWSLHLPDRVRVQSARRVSHNKLPSRRLFPRLVHRRSQLNRIFLFCHSSKYSSK